MKADDDTVKPSDDFDILESIPSPTGKLKYAVVDMSRHTLFSLEKGYVRYALAVPFVRLCSYLNYWRGYRHSWQNSRPVGRRVNVNE
jgi:hypothetical protein